MAKVEIKQPIVDEISGFIADAQSLVLVDYRGLTVEQDTVLRKSLREADVHYKVYKNTLIKRAIAGTQFEQIADLLEGPTAVAVSSSDATAPARVLAKAAETMDKLEIKGGVVEGVLYDTDKLKDIAKIQSKEVLIGRLLGSMKSPISNFARVLNQIAEKNGGGAPAAEETAEAPAEA
ncbi:MAG: 50S ribosomal protein L10 [Lachnospiraceae bacterium]|nr:50S ribosomal protein L10 [Lachnospiraceae bacterium]